MPHQEDSLEVLRVRTRETLTRHDIAQLILRGARACGFPVPGAILAELCLEPGNEKLGIFVGLMGGTPAGVVIGELPMSAFSLAPMVLMAYSGWCPRDLVTLIGSRLREWMATAGFDRALALNLRHTDRSFMRGLRHFGFPVRVGGVIAFQLTPSGD